MTAFKDNPEEWQRLDYQILQNGWTSLYWQQDILVLDIGWFKNEDFKIIEIDCINWTESNTFLIELGRLLDFPDYYGKNLDAFNDCLSDIEIDGKGTVVVFRHFDHIENKFAHTLLDIFADNSRRHILFGKKLLTLIQVDNPNYQIDPIGSSPVLWNGAEWLNSKRGL